VKGSRVPPITRPATARSTAGWAGTAGLPSVNMATGSTARLAARNCTAVTATGSRPGSNRAWATVKAAEIRTAASTMASPRRVVPAARPPTTRPTPASEIMKPAQASGRIPAWCQQAAMIAISTGAAPTNRAAWLTLVWVMPAFCTTTDPP
jgi:hypothetical protein